MARSCNFTFTHNNYPDTCLEDDIECQYIIYGKEIGASGTPHLQGLIRFGSQRTLSSVIKKLPGCHVEIARSLHHAIEYCKKDGDFTERGIAPSTAAMKGAAEQDRWASIRLAAEEGRYDDIPEKIRFNNKKLIEDHHHTALTKRKLDDTEETHLWYYGGPGTGKSRKAREENPDAYLKMCNKWWDGYTDEDVVLLEDFDKIHNVLGHHMKIWGDRYPYLAEVKGGAFKIRPKKIIVTSNYHPKDIWEYNATLLPILRRFKCVEFHAPLTNKKTKLDIN